MQEFERIEVEESLDKLWLGAFSSAGLFLTVFVLWSVLEPAISLALTLVILLFQSIVVRSLVILSNMAVHSRHLAFRDVMTSMVHTNLIHSRQGEQYGRNSIDDATLAVEDLFRQASEGTLRGQMYESNRRRPLASFVYAGLTNLFLLIVAATLGLYFSSEVKGLVGSASQWVASLN